jgi:hypothetical protein
MTSTYAKMSVYELTAMRTTLLRGITAPRYSTYEEREFWERQVAAITEELTRRNEAKP